VRLLVEPFLGASGAPFHHPAQARPGFVMRMTRGPTDGCINFDVDGDDTTATVQIALNEPGEYKGGRSCFFVNDQLHVVERPAGTVCRHPPQVLHAVTALTEGTIKSLFVVDASQDQGADDATQATADHVTAFAAARVALKAHFSRQPHASLCAVCQEHESHPMLLPCGHMCECAAMTSETQAPPRLRECLETLLEHLGPAEQRALAATSRGYRAAVAQVYEACPDTFEALVGAPGAWTAAALEELGAISARAARLPELRLNLARAVDACGRVRVRTVGWHGFSRISFAHAGAACDLGDDFLRDCAADEVDYAGCTGVARAGDGWMSRSRIDRVRYEDLGALAAVGDRWMAYCAALATPDFAGLGALAAVGREWMAHCPARDAPMGAYRPDGHFLAALRRGRRALEQARRGPLNT
jgi:hypothetical protein